MVVTVYSFMKKEVDSSKMINVNQIQNHVSEGTGVSLNTLKHILKEHKCNKHAGKQFSTPHKKRPRRKIDKSVIIKDN
jgi:signal recognition particle GTPase